MFTRNQHYFKGVITKQLRYLIKIDIENCFNRDYFFIKSISDKRKIPSMSKLIHQKSRIICEKDKEDALHPKKMTINSLTALSGTSIGILDFLLNFHLTP